MRLIFCLCRVDVVGELPHCARFYSALKPHVRRLFPSPAAKLYLEDLASSAIKCFVSVNILKQVYHNLLIILLL